VSVSISSFSSSSLIEPTSGKVSCMVLLGSRWQTKA
jgi:hypothetical protein